MNFEFSKINDPIATSSISLNTVYSIDADMSYDTIKNVRNDSKDLIALRTIKGKGDVYIPGFDNNIVTENTLIIFEYSKVKRYYCANDEWKFWWFQFYISDPLFFPINTIIDIKGLINEESICQNCLDLLRNEQNYSKALASSYFSQLLYSWMYHLQYEKHRLKHHYISINNVIEFLHSNLHQNIKVSQMAQMCNLSERRFREVFIEQTGAQPKQYYKNLKMKFAKELLINTSLSIGEIANRLGYSNQFYFSRAFTQFYNIAPSIYITRK